MKKASIRDLDLRGKRLFIRVDFNVPLQEGKVGDDTRIRAALPTIQMALERRARVILASHLGRPGGERRPELSLQPVADYLSHLLDRPVQFVKDCVGPETRQTVDGLPQGDTLLLENLRFHAEETANDASFARQLADLADLYVNDAFGTAHRAHASTVGVPSCLGQGAAGLLVEKELEVLEAVLESAKSPLVAIFGGAKVSDKIDVIENFLGRASDILLGGGMAFTFLHAQGHSIGRSLLEQKKLDTAAHLLEKAGQRRTRIHLPVDVIVTPEIAEDADTRIGRIEEIPPDLIGADIGPETTAHYQQVVGRARTLIWNGPMGVFEIEAFARGTQELAKAVGESDAFTVIGGGDTLRAVNRAGIADKITHLSTGGGASLEILAGKKLPGIEVLDNKEA